MFFFKLFTFAFSVLNFLFLATSLSTTSFTFFTFTGIVFSLPKSKSSAFVFRLFKLQSWTKLVETKIENPVNSRNGSVFQIPSSPPYSPISMLNLDKFCCQNPKTVRITLIWRERGCAFRFMEIFHLMEFFVISE